MGPDIEAAHSDMTECYQDDDLLIVSSTPSGGLKHVTSKSGLYIG